MLCQPLTISNKYVFNELMILGIWKINIFLGNLKVFTYNLEICEPQMCLVILQIVCDSFVNMFALILDIFIHLCRNPSHCSESNQLFRWRGLLVSMFARHHSRLFVRHQHRVGYSEVGGMSIEGQVWKMWPWSFVQNITSIASIYDM